MSNLGPDSFLRGEPTSTAGWVRPVVCWVLALILACVAVWLLMSSPSVTRPARG